MTRILILVEDDDLKAKAVTRYATRIGYVTVLRAATLNVAFDLLERYKDYAVVVTDWCFPWRVGLGAEDNLGRHVVDWCRGGTPRVPVRVFSGRDVPATGYEDIWFDSLSANGLCAWLEEEYKK